jgi:TRAP-type C4-dicarboxylate transport system permease large subunit
LRDVVWGVIPFVALMMLAVVVMCFVPEIATWFPNRIMS